MSATKNKVIQGSSTPKYLVVGIVAVVLLLVTVLATTIFLTVRHNSEFSDILEDSVKAQLISSSIAAREIAVDNLDLFNAINSPEDINAHWPEWLDVVSRLRLLNDEIGGEYIYVLKKIDDVAYFVFDTDVEAQRTRDIFTPYELSPVHEAAFNGVASAGIMNVADEWGSYNTGAVPLYDEMGEIVGIVVADIDDTFINRNQQMSAFYTIILTVSTSISVVVLLLILFALLHQNNKMQRSLYELANFDAISGLPNRNNLFTFLAGEIGRLKKQKHHFAVFFIDLDNFKTVNDHAGHDTGDELLRNISKYLAEHANESKFASVNGIDALTSRIGGDEFLQLLPGVSSAEEASAYAQSLLDGFAKEDTLRKFIENFSVGLSIGIAIFPEMQTDYDELIKYADIAMYHAKKNGKNNYKIYDEAMGDDVEGAELSVRQARGER